jgi:glycerophosphoryl diester phosphodiesterase
MTKDGVLVARHENEISETTNVAEVFPNKKTTKTVDDLKVAGWFVEDFTLAEIKKLKAKQRLAFRPQMDQQPFLIATLDEIIDAVDQYTAKTGKSIGIVPEIKHSSYFRSIGVNMEKALLKTLEDKKWDKKLDQIYIQSFEVSNLKELATLSKYHLVQLLGDPAESPYDLKGKTTYADMVTLDGLKEIRKYAQVLGPHKKYLVVENAKSEMTLVANDVLKNAKLLDLKIIPYTFRNESFFVMKPLTDPMKEYEFFYKIGVDGVFSDFPDTAVKAIKIGSEATN